MSRRTIIITVAVLVPLTCVLVLCSGVVYMMSFLGAGYETTGGKVQHRSFNNLNWQIERHEVKGADPRSLRTLPSSGGLYAADANAVYFKTTLITAADPATFQVLDWRRAFSRDAKQVYWKSIALGSDPDGFRILGAGYSKDSGSVYYLRTAIEGADVATFEVTNEVPGQARDKNHRYNLGRRIE